MLRQIDLGPWWRPAPSFGTSLQRSGPSGGWVKTHLTCVGPPLRRSALKSALCLSGQRPRPALWIAADPRGGWVETHLTCVGPTFASFGPEDGPVSVRIGALPRPSDRSGPARGVGQDPPYLCWTDFCLVRPRSRPYACSDRGPAPSDGSQLPRGCPSGRWVETHLTRLGLDCACFGPDYGPFLARRCCPEGRRVRLGPPAAGTGAADGLWPFGGPVAFGGRRRLWRSRQPLFRLAVLLHPTMLSAGQGAMASPAASHGAVPVLYAGIFRGVRSGFPYRRWGCPPGQAPSCKV
jgi:hypothetical protein